MVRFQHRVWCQIPGKYWFYSYFNTHLLQVFVYPQVVLWCAAGGEDSYCDGGERGDRQGDCQGPGWPRQAHDETLFCLSLRLTTINGLIGTQTGTLNVIKVTQALNCGSLLNVNPVGKNRRPSEESGGNAHNQRELEVRILFKEYSSRSTDSTALLRWKSEMTRSESVFFNHWNDAFNISYKFFLFVIIAMAFLTFYFSL